MVGIRRNLIFGFISCALALGAVSCHRNRQLPRDLDASVAEKPRIPGPPKWLFTKKFAVMVRATPSVDGEKLGLLRSGSMLRAKTDIPVGNDGCPGGWYELATGGFVCSGKDVVPQETNRPPQLPPAQPNLEQTLPYTYGHTRKSRTPMYKRPPTEAEIAEVELPKPAPELEGEVTNVAQPVPPENSEAETQAETDRKLVADAPAPMPSTAIVDGDGGVAMIPTLKSLQGDRHSIVRRYLERGFLVSLDREVKAGNRTYWRTMSNGFVPAERLFPLSGSAFQGVVLPENEPAVAAGFVTSGTASLYKTTDGVRMRRGDVLGFQKSVRITEEKIFQRATYGHLPDDQWVRTQELRVIHFREPPKDISPTQKWIDIDLDRQSLVAYEGPKPVYATLISSGRLNKYDPEKDHQTPVGEFKITSKYVTHTMDGDHATDGPYSIEDVPYVMYFQLAYAMHSAFWHNQFGHPKSHGCINMAPKDAKWLFTWADPILPKGWHAVLTSSKAAYTRVFIHGQTPTH